MPGLDFSIAKQPQLTLSTGVPKFSSLLENGPLNRSLSIALAASFQLPRLKKFGC